MYEELTKARSELKTIQTRAFEENQQLAQQLANQVCSVSVSVFACCQPPSGGPGKALQSISIANGCRPSSNHIETRVLQNCGPSGAAPPVRLIRF